VPQLPHLSRAATMKFVSTFTILAIIGLGQAYPSPSSDVLRSDVVRSSFNTIQRLVNTASSKETKFVKNVISRVYEKTLIGELMDFLELLPVEQFVNIMVKYITEDQKVQNAILYMFTPEFHSILRDVEALNEDQALVAYLEKAGLPVIQIIQELHKTIGMEEYVPPKVESLLRSQSGVQKIGDGMKGMIEDLYNILPIDKIDALYKEKLQNSKVFSDFIEKITSKDMQKLVDDLYENQTYKSFVMTCRDKGLEFQELTKLTSRIFGIKFPY